MEIKVKDYNPYLGYLGDFVRENEQLVLKVASKYRWAVKRGISFEDLISEGRIGLIKAFRRYDGKRYHTTFSTYAYYIISGEIKRFIRKSVSNFNVPRPLYERAGAVIKHDLTDKTASEVANAIGCSIQQANEVLQYLQKINVISMNENLQPDSKDEVFNLIGHETDLTGIIVSDFLQSISTRERKIVQLRMLGMTQQEIASQIGTSQAHVHRLLYQIGLKLNGYNMEVQNMEKLTKEKYLELKKQGLPDTEIMKKFPMASSTFYRLKRRWGLLDKLKEQQSKNEPTEKTLQIDGLKQESEKTKTDHDIITTNDAPPDSSALDPIDHLAHYTAGKVECIDAIESATAGLTGGVAYCTGAAIEYLWLWSRKGGVEDLKKARWYIDRLIHLVERGQSDAAEQIRTNAAQ